MKFEQYTKRPIRFLELHQHQDWKIKIYSISAKSEKVAAHHVMLAKQQLSDWLQKTDGKYDSYKIATLIIHEGNDVCFSIINWWLDENMLQHFVYYSEYEKPEEFRLFSANGIVTCVWEMAVLWFERNAWVDYVLTKNEHPDFEGYFNQQLNSEI